VLTSLNLYGSCDQNSQPFSPADDTRFHADRTNNILAFDAGSLS
jgi:hypothetical protein